jgi:hypothetical protein
MRNEIKNWRAGTGKQEQERSSRIQKLESKKILQKGTGHHDIRISWTVQDIITSRYQDSRRAGQQESKTEGEQDSRTSEQQDRSGAENQETRTIRVLDQEIRRSESKRAGEQKILRALKEKLEAVDTTICR